MIRENEPSPTNMGPLPQGGPSIDLVKMAWNHRWMLLLGLAAGCGGGYFYFTKQPPVYQSTARIQIVEPYARNMPVEGVETQTQQTRSLADEALVMRSEKVLAEAAELGQLSELPGFAGATGEAIASSLAASRNLAIKLSGESSQSSIFDVSFTSGDPEMTQRVVQATIDAYAKHLRMQHQNIGEDTVRLIDEARGELLERLEKLEHDFDDFRKTSPLLYRDGKSNSVHRDNADKFLTQKQTLVVQQAQLKSALTTAAEALRAGEDPEAILLALQGSGENGVDTLFADITNDEVARLKEEARITRSQEMRESELLPLKIREQELLEAYAEGHPTVKALRTRMELIETAIEAMEKDEKEFRAKMDQALTAAKENSENQGDPREALMNRVRLAVLARRQQLKSVEQEIAVIAEAYESEIKAAREEGAAELEFQRYERDIARQQELYNRIVARLDEMNIMAGAEGLRIDTLDSPKKGYQIGPSLSKSLGLGGFIGLLIAGALAYLIDISDKSYHSAEQIAEHLKLPVIGHVPSVPFAKKEGAYADSKLDPSLVTHFKSKSKHSEAFKAIRTALYFSNQGGDQKVLQITSAVPSDGKSTVSANSAIAIAQSGKSVLLIDSDMRRPRVQKLFGVEAQRGLAWLLEEIPRNASKSEVIEMMGEAIVDTEVPNLSIMGAGMRPDNPSELLSSAKFDALLDAVRDKFDMIIIDSPPMLAVTDPSNVAPRVDGVILVVRVRKNVKPLAAQAARMLETLEANVLGVVVNGVGSREAKGYGKYGATDGYYNRGSYYKYGYGYTYGYSYSYGNKYNEYYDDDHKKNGKSKEKVKKVSV